MSEPVHIRELQQVADYAQLLDLQQTVWQMSPADCVSPHIMRAATLNGGVVIGAQHGGRLVGFCFGFAAKRGQSWLLWSFATGVHPDYQGQGLGYRLKHAQRVWARANGYTAIGWTFDPLQRGNANFNLNRLGATVRSLHLDFYGQVTDGINQGLASDRFEVLWSVSDTTPPGPVQGEAARQLFLLRSDEHSSLVDASTASWDADAYAVEIPFDIRALKRDDLPGAIQWQLAFRAAVQRAFAEGLTVYGFVVEQRRCWYVLRRP